MLAEYSFGVVFVFEVLGAEYGGGVVVVPSDVKVDVFFIGDLPFVLACTFLLENGCDVE